MPCVVSLEGVAAFGHLSELEAKVGVVAHAVLTCAFARDRKERVRLETGTRARSFGYRNFPNLWTFGPAAGYYVGFLKNTRE